MHHRKLGELQQTLRATETNGISLASTELPLNLISSLLRDVAVQSEKETIASENETIEKLLVDRDERLLVFLEHKNAGAEMQNLVHEFMEEDRAHRNTVQDLETRLILSPEAKRLLDQILEHGLSKKSCECERLLEALENTRNELEAVQRLVAATPREETARKVAQELKEASAELASYDQKKRQLEKRLSSLRSERETIEKQLKRLRRNLVEEEILEEEDSRMGRLLIRTQETMKDFLQCSLAKKIDRLAQLITESLRYLMRKKTLIGYVQVDPETFVITLFDESGHSLPKQRLSEGEKQILAISVLWGLSRASKRQIPTIIDTPMARLDVKHREALLKRYFPHASNQVIVLSTDTEVDSRYFTMLEPHIARAYHLEYDDDKKATTAQEGYFWNPSAPQIAHQGVGS
jgi:DNA sulfur modification protein DndD